jgi:hypothetical protein
VIFLDLVILIDKNIAGHFFLYVPRRLINKGRKNNKQH